MENYEKFLIERRKLLRTRIQQVLSFEGDEMEGQERPAVAS